MFGQFDHGTDVLNMFAGNPRKKKFGASHSGQFVTGQAARLGAAVSKAASAKFQVEQGAR